MGHSRPTESVVLEPILEDPPQDTSGAPTVRILYEASQSQAPMSLRFQLVISNEAGSALTLTSNPYHDLSYVLCGDDGWPVGLPTPPQQAKLHGDSSTKQQRVEYLILDGARLDDREIALDQFEAESMFRLETGSSLTCDVAVAHLKGGGSSLSRRPIEAGNYSISIVLPISFTILEQERRILLTSDDVAIRVCEVG